MVNKLERGDTPPICVSNATCTSFAAAASNQANVCVSALVVVVVVVVQMDLAQVRLGRKCGRNLN